MKEQALFDTEVFLKDTACGRILAVGHPQMEGFQLTTHLQIVSILTFMDLLYDNLAEHN